jgi:radical SAM protein with 4Fe4S-binding SPASM domain
MDCSQAEWLDNGSFLEDFNQRIFAQRIPVSGSISLTHRCNLACPHCYIPFSERKAKKPANELSSAEINDYLTQAAAAGCLYLLITGGEPLLRKDFHEIYRQAKKLGLIITVFSNGTLIDSEVMKLFDEWPPHTVEISLYGCSRQTYEAVTKVTGSFEKCLAGIELLQKHHIHLRVKTVLLKTNLHEISDLQKLADSWGLSFHFDAAIFGRFDKNTVPLELRVDPAMAVNFEFKNNKNSIKWQQLIRQSMSLPADDFLFRCGAGVSTFHINPFGYLQPCLLVSWISYPLKQGNFSHGWEWMAGELKKLSIPPDMKCANCPDRLLCGYCPAFFKLESGSCFTHSPYLCELGHYRRLKIEALEPNK